MDRRPRSLTLLALFFAIGLCALAYMWATVHQRKAAEFEANPASRLVRTEMQQWMRHGYFASYGLRVTTSDPDRLYRSWPGDFRLTAYAVVALAGFDWRVLAFHNLLISLVAAVLLALLAYRLAVRTGMEPLHAVLLAMGVEMVQFTFPENVAIFWAMTA